MRLLLLAMIAAKLDGDAAAVHSHRRTQSAVANCTDVNQCHARSEFCDTRTGACRSCAAAAGAACGCVDRFAANFNASAVQDDGSCDYSALCKSGSGWTCTAVPSACQYGNCSTASYSEQSSRVELDGEKIVYRYASFTNLQYSGDGGQGGAIHAKESSSLVITSCTFTGNAVDVDDKDNTFAMGGAIYAIASAVSITSSAFTSNSAVSKDSDCQDGCSPLPSASIDVRCGAAGGTVTTKCRPWSSLRRRSQPSAVTVSVLAPAGAIGRLPDRITYHVLAGPRPSRPHDFWLRRFMI